MKKFLIITVVLCVALFLSALPVFSSDLTNADYHGIIYATNNSTATTAVSCNVSGLNVNSLVGANYIDAACTRVAITDSGDVPFMPGYGTNPWIIYVSSVGANATVSYSFYTGNATLASTKYYFPDTTGATVGDNTTIELSSNGSLPWSGRLDMSISNSIIKKTDAIYLNTSSSGNVVGYLAGNGSFNPTGTNDPSTGWNNDANAIDGNTGTNAQSAAVIFAGAWSTYLELTFPSTNISAFRFWCDYGAGSQETAQIDLWNGSAWTNCYNANPSNLAWTTAYLSAPMAGITKARFRQYSAAAGGCWINLYEFQYSPCVSVPTTSGEHDVSLTLDGTNLILDVDGTQNSIALSGHSVPDNANNYTFCSSSTPYMESSSIYVGGNRNGYWYWEYGATFADHGIDATSCVMTPTFRTTSSDADVSAYLASFEPIDPAEAPATTVQDAPDYLSGNITATGNFTAGSVPATGGPPGFAAIEQIATDTSTPLPWVWGILAMLTIGIFGIGLSYAHKHSGIGGGYVLMCMALPLVVFALLIAFGKFDWWMMWYYLIIATGIAIASRHTDVGGSTSQHSLIGFLAMAWIGLTLINNIMGGQFLTSDETAWINNVSFTQNFNFLNLFFIPIMNFKFFTDGIPQLLNWNYTMFGGQAQIIQYLLYSITAVVSFILFTVLLGLIYSAFSRSRV